MMGDDMVVPTPPRKPGKRRDPSHLPTPTTASPVQQNGKSCSSLSPATEAAIQQMPEEIENAIKSLKSIKNIVEGLLEFKVILDSEAARLLPAAARN